MGWVCHLIINFAVSYSKTVMEDAVINKAGRHLTHELIMQKNRGIVHTKQIYRMYLVLVGDANEADRQSVSLVTFGKVDKDGASLSQCCC